MMDFFVNVPAERPSRAGTFAFGSSPDRKANTAGASKQLAEKDLEGRAQLYRLLKNSALDQDTTLQTAETLCFVSGHDFSRAVNVQKYVGL
jgi:hypothetical protein